MSGVGEKALAWAADHEGKHPCEVCGAPVNIFPVYFYMGPKIPRYCSRQCSSISQRKPKVELTCRVCGKTWLDFPSKAKLRVTCSRECYRQLQRQWYAKEGNPNWRGGIQYLRMMIRNSPLHDQFRSDVLHRDGFCCRECGAQATKKRHTGELDAHHIETVYALLAKMFDPDNGITLCRACHTSKHAAHLS